MSELSTMARAPDKGRHLRAFGEEVNILLGGTETGGRFTNFLEVTPPGGGPPPHYHESEDSWYFPVAGRVEFLLDGEWSEMPMESMVFVPQGTLHTFRNPGETPLKMLIHTVPSGFEVFFERCADVFAEPGPADMERIMQISSEHGIHFVTD